MPRPRFEKLEPAVRATILARAAEEFAEHGYEGASYNRIIERSGLSKGAMYYYFDDKQDLFVTTLQDAVTRLIVDAGSVEAAKDAESFWQAVESWCERSLRLFRADPAAVGLLRAFIKNVERGQGSAALSELRRMGRLCMRAFIASGRAVSAIRDDLPEELLTSILMSLEEGMDVWISDHEAEFGDDQLAELARLMASLYRRVAAPEETTTKRNAPRKTAAARPRKGRVR
jgi:AcrR family transcriptional regulator